jgi:hypothetical protein
MNTYVHLSELTTNDQIPTPCFLTADEREYTQMVDEKLCCCAAHGQGRVGRRVASRKTLLQRFLRVTTAGKVFPKPMIAERISL